MIDWNLRKMKLPRVLDIKKFDWRNRISNDDLFPGANVANYPPVKRS